MGKVYNLPASGKLAAIVAALREYYGEGITIYGSSSSELVFAIPSISTKVIRIYGTGQYLAFGDAWTTGTSITGNVVTAVAHNRAGSGVAGTLLLHDTGLMYTYTDSYNFQTCLFKLSNGSAIAGGTTSYNYTADYQGERWYRLDDLLEIINIPFTLPSNVIYPTGGIVTWPMTFMTTSGVAILNVDGTFADALDFKKTSSRSSVLTATNYCIIGGVKYSRYSDTYGPEQSGIGCPITP